MVSDTRVESGVFCRVEQGREQVAVWSLFAAVEDAAMLMTSLVQLHRDKSRVVFINFGIHYDEMLTLDFVDIGIVVKRIIPPFIVSP